MKKKEDGAINNVVKDATGTCGRRTVCFIISTFVVINSAVCVINSTVGGGGRAVYGEKGHFHTVSYAGFAPP